jgi:hypothetical protein
VCKSFVLFFAPSVSFLLSFSCAQKASPTPIQIADYWLNNGTNIHSGRGRCWSGDVGHGNNFGWPRDARQHCFLLDRSGAAFAWAHQPGWPTLLLRLQHFKARPYIQRRPNCRHFPATSHLPTRSGCRSCGRPLPTAQSSCAASR